MALRMVRSFRIQATMATHGQLTGGAKASVESGDDRVEANGCEGAHIQHLPNLGAAAPDAAAAAQGCRCRG